MSLQENSEDVDLGSVQRNPAKQIFPLPLLPATGLRRRSFGPAFVAASAELAA